MALERQLPGWGFWGRWVLVSAVGFGLGAFLGMCLAWATVGVVATGPEVAPKFFSMAYLETMGGPGDAGRDLRYSAIYAPGGEFIYWTVTIAWGGLVQWLFLRRHVGWAKWWAFPVPLYLGFLGLTKETIAHVGAGIWFVVFDAKDFALGGAFFSAIAGIPLVWLLRRSYRKAVTAGNASL